MATLISFDIDGTLEVGNPPGYITIERVREALALGYIVGSCSDWPVSWQQSLWQEHGIPVAFTVLKHHLDRVRAESSAEQYVHIGVAVDTKGGLLVPVIRDVDKKGVSELAQELNDAAEKARNGKAEMRGGTFTITNLGGIGGTGFTPIVNWPEVAILGLSRGRMEPVWKDGAFVPRLMMPLSLSYDHRVIDGADAARNFKYAEAFEVCEYGRRPTPEEIKELFPFFESR